MALRIEIYHSNTWVNVAELKRGDPLGSISDNKADGSRDIYMFECLADDSVSTI